METRRYKILANTTTFDPITIWDIEPDAAMSYSLSSKPSLRSYIPFERFLSLVGPRFYDIHTLILNHLEKLSIGKTALHKNKFVLCSTFLAAKLMANESYPKGWWKSFDYQDITIFAENSLKIEDGFLIGYMPVFADDLEVVDYAIGNNRYYLHTDGETTMHLDFRREV